MVLTEDDFFPGISSCSLCNLHSRPFTITTIGRSVFASSYHSLAILYNFSTLDMPFITIITLIDLFFSGDIFPKYMNIHIIHRHILDVIYIVIIIYMPLINIDIHRIPAIHATLIRYISYFISYMPLAHYDGVHFCGSITIAIILFFIDLL
ncbi:hypothetical protein V1521DRAFT_439860 [Lipomyces starkeyi]